MPPKQDSLTADEIKSLAESKGKKLGFLIASLNITPETREALLSLLPQLSLEQLDEFTTLLETNFLYAATEGIDRVLIERLQEIDTKYKEEIRKADEEAVGEMRAIEQQLQAKAN